MVAVATVRSRSVTAATQVEVTPMNIVRHQLLEVMFWWDQKSGIQR